MGVDPDARITWWNWDKPRRRSTVAKKVSDRQADADSRGSFQIYMFATSWPTGVHNSRASRMNDGLAKRFVVQEKPLVVAAAGEADPLKGELPQDVTFSTAEAPMNLGDQENVIIVTGCSPCVAPSAQLLANANMSASFVHVAAPARDVLSTASGAKYTKGSGTSQATAFVAGLASAMVSRFPDIYKDAAQVKVRLQATSMPIELIGDPSATEKLAAGVIDPAFAILDPRKYWLKTGGGDPEPYDAIAWEVPSLNINVDGHDETVATKDIWRISSRDGSSVVYTGFRRGPIKKIGPGPLTAGAGTTAVCKLTVRPQDGAPVTTAVTLDQIEDLVLKYPTSAQ